MLVVECSSFQLAEQDSLHPRVSVLLNLAPGPSGLARLVRGLRGGEGAHLREPDRGGVHVGNLDDEAAAGCRAVPRAGSAGSRWDPPQPRAPRRRYRDGWLVAVSDVVERVSRPVARTPPMLRADAAACAASCLALASRPTRSLRASPASSRPPHRGKTVAVVDARPVRRQLEGHERPRGDRRGGGFRGCRAGGRRAGEGRRSLTARVRAAARLRAVVAIGEAAIGSGRGCSRGWPRHHSRNHRGGGPGGVRPCAARRHRAARTRVRQLGPIRRLRGAGRSVRSRRARARGDERAWLGSAARKGGSRAVPARRAPARRAPGRRTKRLGIVPRPQASRLRVVRDRLGRRRRSARPPHAAACCCC